MKWILVVMIAQWVLYGTFHFHGIGHRFSPMDVVNLARCMKQIDPETESWTKKWYEQKILLIHFAAFAASNVFSFHFFTFIIAISFSQLV